MRCDNYIFDDFDCNRCPQNRNLITNFKKDLEPLYRKAIELYGWDGLFITDEAYWMNGYRDDSMSALRCKNFRDLSGFWRIFRELEDNFNRYNWFYNHFML